MRGITVTDDFVNQLFGEQGNNRINEGVSTGDDPYATGRRVGAYMGRTSRAELNGEEQRKPKSVRVEQANRIARKVAARNNSKPYEFNGAQRFNAGFIRQRELDAQDEAYKKREAVELHSCPLCESELEWPISDERLQEHIDFFLEVINENFNIDGESLDERDESEEDYEADDA